MKKIYSFISQSGAKASKKLAMLLGILLLSGGAFSQLDSVSIVGATFTQEIVTDSIGGSDTLEVMNVEIYTNDIDFLGEVVVTVSDPVSNFPLAKGKVTKQEAITAGIVSGNNVTISLDALPSAQSYKIEVLVRNYQGANLPLITINHN